MCVYFSQKFVALSWIHISLGRASARATEREREMRDALLNNVMLASAISHAMRPQHFHFLKTNANVIFFFLASKIVSLHSYRDGQRRVIHAQFLHGHAFAVPKEVVHILFARCVFLLRSVEGRPDGITDEESHCLDVVSRIEREAVIHALGQHNHIALSTVDADPAIILISDVEVSTAEHQKRRIHKHGAVGVWGLGVHTYAEEKKVRALFLVFLTFLSEVTSVSLLSLSFSLTHTYIHST